MSSCSGCPLHEYLHCWFESAIVATIVRFEANLLLSTCAHTPALNQGITIITHRTLIAMPTVMSVTMAIGSHKLSQQGAITKRMTAIEEMADMDVSCNDKTETLTLNKLSVDRNLVEIYAKGMEKDHVLLLAARASRTENQDAIDAAMVGMLADPKDV